MKLALLIALTADKRSGQAISSGLIPLDEAKVAFKEAVAAGVTPLPGHPILEVWASGGIAKSRRLGDPVPVAAAETPEVEDESPTDLAPVDAEAAAAEAAAAEAEVESPAKPIDDDSSETRKKRVGK